MNRRELLKSIAAATGAAFVGTNVLAYDIVPAVSLKQTNFSKEDVALFNEIAEVIIPRTDTPGAKDANVGEIMAVLVSDCYTKEQQDSFREGVAQIQQLSEAQYGKSFLLLSTQQRFEMLSTLDDKAKIHNLKLGLLSVETQRPSSRDKDSIQPLPHPFSLIKQLTLYGFFTSQVGANKVLRYISIPGKYDGEMPYQKGDRAWAT